MKEIWLKIWKFIWYFVLAIGAGLLLVTVMLSWRVFIASGQNLLTNYIVSINYDEAVKAGMVEILTAPGVDTHLRVNVAESIQEHWRSGDLQFILQDAGAARQLVQLDLSKSDRWGEVLQVKELSEPVTVTFNFILPAETATGNRLPGLLSGRIEYPVSEPGGFRTQMKTLYLPIEVVVLTSAELVKQERSDNLDMIKKLGPIALGLILAPVMVLYLTNRRSKISRSHFVGHEK